MLLHTQDTLGHSREKFTMEVVFLIGPRREVNF